MKTSVSGALLAISVTAFAATPAAAEPETIKLTVAASHPVTIPWIALIPKVFIPEVDKRLAATGKYKIQWQQAYGGQIYKANATLTSVEQGITDIGWVFSYLEAAKMPLSQVTTYTPFSTDNVPAMLNTMTELMDTVPAFRKEWEKYNIVFLGATGSDTYDVFTKFPVKKIEDLKGKKISSPGAPGIWLRGVGATPVDGALTTFYTDIQTGVSEGVLSLATGVLPTKLYEVAPYVTRVNLGVVFSGGLAINQDRWAGLPKEVQTALKEAGAVYSKTHGEDLMERHESAMKAIVEAGKTQNPPVTIYELPPEERRKWIDQLPNLAAEWVKANEAKGLPARKFLEAYMAGLRKQGQTPAREWDKNL
ncbi:C4-dicarboxylate TRAP transporter substrate-binding protein [Azospirillum sp. RWY-5-1]|uniref:C4-dicarboxylate TRAP transporter substrate-binding protein n=1 Tax=Azospirillum oleiclasticum TaxID=2735135 RepID=A0ABX2T9Z5_9PROT|nr:C4-dicarboxylate TRAP transporter substrate-binding protein [Azospirillum oleiclasticum]NYZ13801.1 C4-dicarboxylate TRAP transporter substrate-binding protein [Azospirillum oleiclasticum]NYZ21073.1 C4-dicarboxylate TRAP transporter substrate-binding protein [Azospirillum oleiclasticum]